MRRLDTPAIAITPNTANIQSIKTIDAISRNGPGKIPISQIIKKNIRRSQRVITRFMKLRTGKGNTAVAPYPSSQKIKSKTKIKISIIHNHPIK